MPTTIRKLINERKAARQRFDEPFKTVLGLVVPTRAKSITKPSFKTFHATHNEHHDPELNYVIWNTEIWVSILRERTKQRLLQRPRDCLWWTVSMTPKNGGKATMRKWCIRRTTAAFIRALEARGLDRDGRKLESSTNGVRQLWGSLFLSLSSEALTAPFTQIEQETSALVDTLLKRPSARPSTSIG